MTLLLNKITTKFKFSKQIQKKIENVPNSYFIPYIVLGYFINLHEFMKIQNEIFINSFNLTLVILNLLLLETNIKNFHLIHRLIFQD